MKRFCLTIVISILMLSLSAKAITGTGTGKTREEAIENSRRDCISLISFDFTSSQIVSTTDDGEKEKKSMEITSHQYMTVELIGAETTVQFDNGVYEATTTIPEESAHLYATKVKEALKDISTLKGQADAKGASVTSEDYLVLLDTLKKFEQYRTIVGLLNPEDPVKNLTPDFSTAMIESLYRSSLEKEMNGLSLTVQDLEQQARLGILEAEGQRKLEAARKSLEETRKKQEEQRLRRQEEISQRMTALEEIVKMSLQDLPSYTATQTETDSLTSLINSIEADRSAFGKYMEMVQHELKAIKNQYDLNVREVSEQYDRQPLGTRTEREGVVYYNNIPEELAREQRNLEKAEVIREMESNSRLNATQIYNSRFPTLKEIRSHAGELLDKLITKTFTFSTDTDGITAYVSNADYKNCLYTGVCNLTVGGKVISINFIIPAEEFVISVLTDNNTIELVKALSKGTIDYETFKQNPGALDYINAFQNWYSLLSLYPELFSISMNVKVSTDGSPSYTLTVDNYTVYRNGNEGRTEIYKNDEDKFYKTRYVNHSSFSYETGFENTLLDMTTILKDDSPLISTQNTTTETKIVPAEEQSLQTSNAWTATVIKGTPVKNTETPPRTPDRNYEEKIGGGFAISVKDSSAYPARPTTSLSLFAYNRFSDNMYQQAEFCLLLVKSQVEKTGYRNTTVMKDTILPGYAVWYNVGYNYKESGMVRFDSSVGLGFNMIPEPRSTKTDIRYTCGIKATAGAMFCLGSAQDGKILPGDTGVTFRLFGMLGVDTSFGFSKGVGISMNIGII